ncbi:right-handed parallel beta-helix repeat-containing protein, partial [Marinifilum flexuosum]|uniref:right-handed parallel beta-helix repeat-containing protein n=1 Tax=Marinifilum flexuosum TaxID=1117708 RepID=UPI00248F7B3B
TIQPGTVIKFQTPSNGYGDKCLIVLGSLKAEGTVNNPIVFTSSRDDNYGGDSNNDQASTLPAARNWGYVKLASNEGSVNLLRHCILKYGGYRYDEIGNTNYSHPYQLWITNSSTEIDNCTLENFYEDGIKAVTNNITGITNNTIKGNNRGSGIAYQGIGGKIEFNTISEVVTGIHYQGNGVNHPQQDVLLGNKIEACTNGIHLNNSKDILLKNNTIKDLSAYPFVQEGFSFPVFE